CVASSFSEVMSIYYVYLSIFHAQTSNTIGRAMQSGGLYVHDDRRSHTRLNGSARDSPALASKVGDVLLPDPPELPVGFGATAHARLPLVSYSHPRPGALRDRGRSATDAPLGRTCARATRPG